MSLSRSHSATQELRNLINGSENIVAPGVYDGMSALLAKRASFKLLYASGGAIARSIGYPDIGLLTMTEVSNVLAHIVKVSQLPVIADADDTVKSIMTVRKKI